MPLTQAQREQMLKLREEVGSLQRHYKVQRVRLSKTLGELIQYCNDHMNQDPLIFPVKENPFKEKKSCDLL